MAPRPSRLRLAYDDARLTLKKKPRVAAVYILLRFLVLFRQLILPFTLPFSRRLMMQRLKQLLSRKPPRNRKRQKINTLSIQESRRLRLDQQLHRRLLLQNRSGLKESLRLSMSSRAALSTESIRVDISGPLLQIKLGIRSIIGTVSWM